LAKSGTIMLVDDEADLLSITKRMLENIGYEVHSFDTPSAALEHMNNGCQDCELLVSDVRMPSMSGFEFVKRAKVLRPDIKVVLMSAFEIQRDEWARVLPSTKVDGFITKPVSLSRLAQDIKQCYRENKL
jgi:DNA-binding NtrC family response regulator